MAAAVLGAATATACGSDSSSAARAGSARVTAAWARDTAPHQTSAAVYLTVVNGTDRRVTVTGARVPSRIASRVQFHTTVEGDGGMTTMHEVASVSVPAHGAFRFAPGHHHMMLVGLAGPLRARQTFPIDLERDGGAPLHATVTVRGL